MKTVCKVFIHKIDSLKDEELVDKKKALYADIEILQKYGAVTSSEMVKLAEYIEFPSERLKVRKEIGIKEKKG